MSCEMGARIIARRSGPGGFAVDFVAVRALRSWRSGSLPFVRATRTHICLIGEAAAASIGFGARDTGWLIGLSWLARACGKRFLRVALEKPFPAGSGTPPAGCRLSAVNAPSNRPAQPESGAPHRESAGRRSSFLGTWADVCWFWRPTSRGAREQPGHPGRGAHEEDAAAAARPLTGFTSAR